MGQVPCRPLLSRMSGHCPRQLCRDQHFRDVGDMSLGPASLYFPQGWGVNWTAAPPQLWPGLDAQCCLPGRGRASQGPGHQGTPPPEMKVNLRGDSGCWGTGSPRESAQPLPEEEVTQGEEPRRLPGVLGQLPSQWASLLLSRGAGRQARLCPDPRPPRSPFISWAVPRPTGAASSPTPRQQPAAGCASAERCWACLFLTFAKP